MKWPHPFTGYGATISPDTTDPVQRLTCCALRGLLLVHRAVTAHALPVVTVFTEHAAVAVHGIAALHHADGWPVAVSEIDDLQVTEVDVPVSGCAVLAVTCLLEGDRDRRLGALANDGTGAGQLAEQAVGDVEVDLSTRSVVGDAVGCLASRQGNHLRSCIGERKTILGQREGILYIITLK